MPRREDYKYQPVATGDKVVDKGGDASRPNDTTTSPPEDASGSSVHSGRATPDQSKTTGEAKGSDKQQAKPRSALNQNPVAADDTLEPRPSISGHQHGDLHEACQALDSERVSRLLKEGVDPNTLVKDLTPLDVTGVAIPSSHKSPLESFLQIIKALTDQDGKPTTVPGANYRQTPLHVAVSLACEPSEGCNSNCEVCARCLKAIDILCVAGYGERLRRSDAEETYVKGAPKPTDKQVYTVLHAAVLKNWLPGVNKLILYGAEINARVLVTANKKGGAEEKHRRSETVLHLAVHNRWLEGVETLLRNGANVDAKLNDYAGGHTPLHMASQRLDMTCLQLLLDYRADTNATNTQNLTPLDVVEAPNENQSAETFLSVVRTLIKNESKASTEPTTKYQTPVHIALHLCCLQILQELKDAGYHKLLQNKEGNTPLHDVASLCSEKLLKELMKLYGGTDLNAQNKQGETALHIAVIKSWEFGVETLLQNGAGITLKNRRNQTVLHVLQPNKNDHVILKKILDHKDSSKIINEEDNCKQLPLFKTIASKHDKCFFLLVDAGADLNSTLQMNGSNVIHSAIKHKQPMLLRSLFKHKKSVADALKEKTITTNKLKNATPLIMAVFEKSLRCVQVLVDNDCNLKATATHEDKTYTALELATIKGYAEIVKILLDKDRSLVNMPDSTGLMPIHWACIHHYSKVIQVIVDHGCDLAAKCIHLESASIQTSIQIPKQNPNQSTVQIPNQISSQSTTQNTIQTSNQNSIQNSSQTIINIPNNTINQTPNQTSIQATTQTPAQRSTPSTPPSEITAMDLFINRVPGAVDLLEEILDSSITVQKNGIKFDYQILLPEVKEETRQLRVLDALVQTGDQVNQGRLFTHPTVESFLDLQWERIRKYYYWIVTLFLFLVAIPFNSLVVILLYDMLDSYWTIFLLVLMGFGAVLYIIHETLYFYSKICNSKYLGIWKFSKDVLFFLIRSILWATKIVFVVLVILYLLVAKSNGVFYRELAICILILLWLEFMLLMSRVPKYGIYMLMFFEVTSNFLVVLFSFMPLIFSFVVAFALLFQGKDPFNSIPEAFLKTIVMMTSEFEYKELFENLNNDQVARVFGKIVFLLFLLVVGIVIMNIVLAKAILDIKKVDRLRKQAEFLSIYEQHLLFCDSLLLRCSQYFGVRFIPRINVGIDRQIEIKFGEANKFSNNLMQSVMEKVYIVKKTRGETPSKEPNKNESNAEFDNHLLRERLASISIKLEKLYAESKNRY